MLSLIFLVEAAAAAHSSRLPVRATSNVTATVRIERAQTVTAEEWNRLPPGSRRELQRIDETGRRIVVRVIEHQ